jgi:hypothetical protein
MNLLLKKGMQCLNSDYQCIMPPMRITVCAQHNRLTPRLVDYGQRGIAALAGPQIGGPDHATPLLGTRSNSRGERLPPTLSLFFSNQPPDDR